MPELRLSQIDIDFVVREVRATAFADLSHLISLLSPWARTVQLVWEAPAEVPPAGAGSGLPLWASASTCARQAMGGGGVADLHNVTELHRALASKGSLLEEHLRSLHGFACPATPLQLDYSKESWARWTSLIGKVARFKEPALRSSASTDLPSDRQLEIMIVAVQGRIALEQGAPVSTAQLAVLGGVSKDHINEVARRTAHSVRRPDEVLTRLKRGWYKHRSACLWLHRRATKRLKGSDSFKELDWLESVTSRTRRAHPIARRRS